MTTLTKAAIIGGGVIGGGWAARFALNGIDVSIFDPDPEAERKVGEVYANAERALRTLCVAPLPTPGKITYVQDHRRGRHRRAMGSGERLRTSRSQAQGLC